MSLAGAGSCALCLQPYSSWLNQKVEPAARDSALKRIYSLKVYSKAASKTPVSLSMTSFISVHLSFCFLFPSILSFFPLLLLWECYRNPGQVSHSIYLLLFLA